MVSVTVPRVTLAIGFLGKSHAGGQNVARLAGRTTRKPSTTILIDKEEADR